MATYNDNDWRDYLEHSWGTSAKQKAREREYNHQYWLNNRERLTRQRLNRQWAGGPMHDANREAYSLESRNRELNRQIDNTNRHLESGFYRDSFDSPNVGQNGGIQARNSMMLEQRQNERRYQELVRNAQPYFERYYTSPVEKVQEYAARAADAVSSAINKIKDVSTNAISNISNLLSGNKKSSGNSMPTNASDLATIERERSRRR